MRIDYLITIDPALEILRTARIDRRVHPCVRRNLHYYQTNPNWVGSYGLPNTAMSSTATYVRSRDLTAILERTGAEPHSRIDNYTYDTVVQKIRDALLTPVD